MVAAAFPALPMVEVVVDDGVTTAVAAAAVAEDDDNAAGEVYRSHRTHPVFLLLHNRHLHLPAPRYLPTISDW